MHGRRLRERAPGNTVLSRTVFQEVVIGTSQRQNHALLAGQWEKWSFPKGDGFWNKDSPVGTDTAPRTWALARGERCCWPCCNCCMRRAMASFISGGIIPPASARFIACAPPTTPHTPRVSYWRSHERGMLTVQVGKVVYFDQPFRERAHQNRMVRSV